jgi:osomolarity two-component system sensor histidine kinase SLN1
MYLFINAGSGLGLAITTKLVHRLGGEIYVESELGKWTKFTVDLPYRECDEPNNNDLNMIQNAAGPLLNNDGEIPDLDVTMFKFRQQTNDNNDNTGRAESSDAQFQPSREVVGEVNNSGVDASPTKSATVSESKISEVTSPYAALKVMIAEDNKINQKLLARMLKRLGIKDVNIVDDGLKAVNLEKDQPFDIILMDMQAS